VSKIQCAIAYEDRWEEELDEAVTTIGSNVTGVQGDIAKLADLDRL
jgi:hypothetical protein